MARPKEKNPRSVRLQIRFTEKDMKRLEKVAERAGMTISGFARANLLTWLDDFERNTKHG